MLVGLLLCMSVQLTQASGWPAIPKEELAMADDPANPGALEDAMTEYVAGQEKIPGKTVLLIDVSGSMMAVIRLTS